MKEPFEEHVVVIGDAPTTYGELRTNCDLTLATPLNDPSTFLRIQKDPREAIRAMKGMALVIKYLLEELEMRQQTESETKK